MEVGKFRTRTMFRHRNNGDSGNKWCVALDIGYSAVKVFSPNVVAMFPSFAKKEKPNYFGDIGAEVILYKNLDTGECWTVGADAQERIDVKDTDISEASLYGRDRYMSPMFRVIAETGIAFGCLQWNENSPGDRDIFIQTGLPPKYLDADDVSMLKDVLSGRHHFSLRMGGSEEMEFLFEIKDENIDIMPQPMGTLYSVLVDNEHNVTPEAFTYLGGNLLIFDPGFGTLDVFPIRQHHLEEALTFPNLGMRQVLQETTEAINEEYSQHITVPAMQKYLAKGAFRYRRRENGQIRTDDIPFDDILEEKNKKVCHDALIQLQQSVPIEEYDYLIITGGTSAAWKPLIHEYFSGMSTLQIIDGNVNDPLPMVFANVRGYFMYRCQELN